MTRLLTALSFSLCLLLALPVRGQTGCVSGSCQDGTGLWRYDSGNTYEGAFQNWQRHGIGTFTWTSGGTFTGTWVNGARVRGSEQFANGNTYDGEYANDKLHGMGTWRNTTGERYVGQFADGKRNGRGTYDWPDGRTYTGDWQDDKRHGHGVMTYASGGRYDGAWRGGDRHGQGTYTWTSGASFTGNWANNARVRGTERYANGNVYDGQYADDKRHGQGTLTHADGRVQAGQWLAGEFQGITASVPSQDGGTQRGFGFTYMPHPGGEDVTLVVAVAPDSPAEQAGMRAGDHLVTVNGESFYGLDLNTIANQLAAAASQSSVMVGVFRPGTDTRSGQEAVLIVNPGPFNVAALRQADAVARERLTNPAPAPAAPSAPAPTPLLSETIPVPRTAPAPDDAIQNHLAFLLHHARTAFVGLRGAPDPTATGSTEGWISTYAFLGRRVIDPKVTHFESEHYPWDHHSTYLAIDPPERSAQAVTLYRRMFDDVLTGWTYAATTEVNGSPSHTWSECANSNTGRSLRLIIHTLNSGDHALVLKGVKQKGAFCRPNDF